MQPALSPPAPPPLPPRARRLAQKRRLREESRRSSAVPPPLWSHHTSLLPHLSVEALHSELREVLRQDTIVSASSGQPVPERRETAWFSDTGRAFRYSGKLMTGGRLPPTLAAVRDALALRFGVSFDSLLVNHYPHCESRMGWHSDPQGAEWAPPTAVVSVGSPRRFSFRSATAPADATQRAEFIVRSGDVVWMGGDCQARLQHAVLPGEEEEAGPRISLVFKLSLAD